MLHLALLWHQHQPVYKDISQPVQAGSYRQPWVRLHAIRDYYSMAALVAGHPDLHLTINLTPVLLWQIEDYTQYGATDRQLELTLKPVEALTGEEREEVLSSFFDAHWHNQIFPHPRYKALFAQRQAGEPFASANLRDLQMWFNLAWFGQEFREDDVTLVTGETVRVRRFVEQGAGFGVEDVRDMLAEQEKLLRAIIPVHRQLQDSGQIEVATTPYAHPILPLLFDSDQATIDRPGTGYPPRFKHPEDAEDQIARAVACYKRHFGRAPRGMWPAEGAVSQAVIPLFASHGVRWIASDRGVLSRSGRWGYNADDPDVLCRVYRAEEDGLATSIFFRETDLSDRIGFHYYSYPDPDQAAADFLDTLKARFARTGTDRIVSVVLDGENAWGAYREDARPFLHALYGLLERDADLSTVTFSEYLDGNPEREIAPHPLASQTKVYELFTGSWIDEAGSEPGVDLGTWIGEPEENRAWELLGHAHDLLAASGASPESTPLAFETLCLAEGSDWFWWLGEDQDSGDDGEFADLFRMHVRNVYRGLEREPPTELDEHIVPRVMLWAFTRPVDGIQAADRLMIRTNCPGILRWRIDRGQFQEAVLSPVGGVMAGVRRFQITLGPFTAGERKIRFRFVCQYPGCDGQDICCSQAEHVVQIGTSNETSEI